MKDALIYYAIFWAIGFLLLGLYLRFKYRDKLNDLDQ